MSIIIRDRSRVWKVQRLGEIELMAMIEGAPDHVFEKVLEEYAPPFGSTYVEVRVYTVIE